MSGSGGIVRQHPSAGQYLIYVRQSYRRDSDADVSEEQQEAAARRLIPSGAGVEVISDAGGHQSGATANRDGYQMLLRRIEDPDVAGVVVYDISRLHRNARLMLQLKHELDRRNLHLIVSNLPDSKFDTAIGRFLFGQLALAAQLQRDLDSERMAGLTRTKHEAGGHNGLDPFGYRTVRDELGRIVRPHRLEVIKEEAAIVVDVFDRYGRGDVSHGDLAAALNAEGIVRRGKVWVEKSVADLLRRAPFYLGQSVYRRGASIVPGTHEPIVSPEQAHLAERSAHRRHRPGRYGRTGRVYPLARIVYCACGLRMRGETLVRPGRREYRYYRCPGRRDGRCSSTNAAAGVVETSVIDHLADHATPSGLVDLMRAELGRLRHLPGEELSGRRARVELAMKRLGDRYVWGELDEAEYRPQRRLLEVQLTELPAPADSNVMAFDRASTTLLPMAQKIRGASPQRAQEIIRHIVERVTIEDGQVVGIAVRLEARPFFDDLGDRMAMAPPDGFEPPTPALGRPRSIH
jgi:DNA invertase Pin-like site-specific DNA recombinase